MYKTLMMGTLLFGLTGCISLSEESKSKMVELSEVFQKDKEVVCKVLVEEHGWRYTQDGRCTKKR